MNPTLPLHDVPRQQIGIAVVERDGCCLVGVRGAEVHLPGKAEFPGGKCHPGESSSECAVRECREETGLSVNVDRLLYECDFDYEHARVRLAFYLCRLIDSEDASEGWRWIPASRLHELNFPEANAPVIQMLCERYRYPACEA
jgi:mutator protein MutT